MQKYCAKCDKIFSSTANFCSWCGQDMRDFKEYKDFKTYAERLETHKQMKRDAQLGNNYKEERKPMLNEQLTLF